MATPTLYQFTTKLDSGETVTRTGFKTYLYLDDGLKAFVIQSATPLSAHLVHWQSGRVILRDLRVFTSCLPRDRPAKFKRLAREGLDAIIKAKGVDHVKSVLDSAEVLNSKLTKAP